MGPTERAVGNTGVILPYPLTTGHIKISFLWNTVLFLGAFAKLRKTTIGF